LSQIKRRPRSPSLDDPKYQSVSLTPVIGLAMAPEALEINLTPDTVTMKRALVSKAKSLTAMGMLLMTALVSASLFATLKSSLLRDRLACLRAEVEEAKPRVQEVARKEALMEVVNARRDARFSAMNLLDAIQNSIPPETFLNGIVIDMNGKDSQVSLDGTAADLGDISKLVNNIKRTAAFADATRGNTSRIRNSKRYRFQVTCVLDRGS
jgi:Tfp pilus assembly protein PilN